MPSSFYTQKMMRQSGLYVRHVRSTFFRFATEVPQNDWKMEAICYMMMPCCIKLNFVQFFI